jgi:[ribosomal protein S18]-alanine N-acetyltransferase
MRALISKGKSADLDAVMPVMQAAFDSRFGEAWSLTQCAGALALSGTALFVARAGSAEWVTESAQGFAFVRSVLDEAELLLIAVHPDCQGHGIGAQLLAHVVEMAQRNGVSRVHVEVRHDNPALTFYARNGFDKIGERRNYYHRNDGLGGTAITLVKQIPQLPGIKVVKI